MRMSAPHNLEMSSDGPQLPWTGGHSITLVTTNGKELRRLGAIRDLDAGRMAASAAATVPGVSERQAFRVLKAYRGSPPGLVSARRGEPSNGRTPMPLCKLAMRLIRGYYVAFGPTLAAARRACVRIPVMATG